MPCSNTEFSVWGTSLNHTIPKKNKNWFCHFASLPLLLLSVLLCRPHPPGLSQAGTDTQCTFSKWGLCVSIKAQILWLPVACCWPVSCVWAFRENYWEAPCYRQKQNKLKKKVTQHCSRIIRQVSMRFFFFSSLPLLSSSSASSLQLPWLQKRKRNTFGRELHNKHLRVE